MFAPAPVRIAEKYLYRLNGLKANVPHLLEQNLALDYKDPLEIALMTKQEREERSICDNLRLIREHLMSYADSADILEKARFVQACGAVGVTNQDLLEELFDDFDDDGSGFVDADEVMQNLRDYMAGDAEEKVFRRIFKLYDNDGSGQIAAVELRTNRGNRTETLMGITQYQKDTFIRMFSTSPWLDNSGTIDFAEFRLLMKNEPELVKSMFSTIMALYAMDRGINLDPDVKRSPKKPGKSNRPQPTPN